MAKKTYNVIVSNKYYSLRLTTSDIDGTLSCIEQLGEAGLYQVPLVTLKAEELKKELSDSQRRVLDIERENCEGFAINPVMQLKRIFELATQSGCLEMVS